MLIITIFARNKEHNYGPNKKAQKIHKIFIDPWLHQVNSSDRKNPALGLDKLFL